MSEETFGQALRRLRGETSVRGLARRANCSKSHIWDLEQGNRQPTPGVARALDAALRAGGALISLAGPTEPAASTAPGGRKLLPVTGKPAGELGWTDAPDPDTFSPDDADRLTWAAKGERADIAVVGLFARLLDQHRAGGPLVKPGEQVKAVSADLRKLLPLRINSAPDVRRALLAVASEYGQFIGRHAFEAGNVSTAERWSVRALEWALAAGATEHASYVLMRRSSYAADLGDAQRVIDLAQASREVPDKLTPGLASLSLRHEAKGHALAGNSDECRRLLDQAIELFDARRPEEEPSYARDHSLTFFQLQAADYQLALGRIYPAIEMLRAHIPALPRSRHRAWSAARLAHGYAQSHDVQAAASLALETVPMAAETGAVRALRELERLHSKLPNRERNQSIVLELAAALLDQRP